MTKLFTQPFTQTQFTKTLHDIEVPVDLVEYINLGKNVARYKYKNRSYDHIFRDFVDEHTKRMVLYAEHLPR